MGIDTLNYIFVGGCERSGTTKLGFDLSNLEGCFSAPEAQFKSYTFGKKLEIPILRESLKNDFRFRQWGLPAEEVYDMEGEDSFEDILRSYRSYNKIPGQAFVDHTPENFNFYVAATRQKKDIKFIHLIRDGRAVYNSLKNVIWGPNSPERAAFFWMSRICPGLISEADGRLFVKRVAYEDYVSDRECFPKLVSELGLIENISSLGRLNVNDYTNSQHLEVQNEPQPDRINAWRANLSKREVEVFEHFAQASLVLLNYEPLSVADSNYRYWHRYYWTMIEEVKRIADSLRFKARAKRV
ncbi:MAG: sulfotransferase [Cyclobacteriaceae bacterium]